MAPVFGEGGNLPTVIEEPEEIDAEAEAEFIEASVPESTADSDDDSDDDFAVEESDEDDDAEPMDVDAGAPALAPTAPAAPTLESAAPEAALVPAATARAPLPFDPTCNALIDTPTSSSYPACRFPLSPQLIRSCSRSSLELGQRS